MMPPEIRDMTPEDRLKFRAMLINHKAALISFADDIKHLVFEAEQSNDHFFDKAVATLIRKLKVFSEAEEAEVFGGLKKEAGGGPRAHGAQRTYGRVVPSKREKARRESGGGNVTSQFEPRGPLPRDPYNVPGMWDDDDDIPF